MEHEPIIQVSELKKAIREVLNKHPDIEDPFFIFDIGKIISAYDAWKKALPRVTPFYAVKCNTNPLLIEILAALGTGFDCASMKELEQILSIGVSPDKIIFGNSVKFPSHIQYARKTGVDLMTFDSIEELNKISKHHPKAKIILRIKSPESGSIHSLSNKFGAHMNDVPKILTEVKRLCLKLVGVSFHVGFHALSSNSYITSIKNSREVFDLAEKHGYHLTVLDIGGGFSAVSEGGTLFQTIAAEIGVAIDKYFPPETDATIIAEPGTFFAQPSFTLVTNVILKKVIASVAHLHLSDGVYGSCHDLTDDRYKILFKPYIIGNEGNSQQRSLTKTKFWGPTCDDSDALSNVVMFPETNAGEWLVVPNWGAYSLAEASVGFNGMPVVEIKGYVVTDEALAIGKNLPAWKYLAGAR